MKLVSYNVNGIRAAISKGFTEWLKQSDIDVICLQEIKATPDQLDELVFRDMGYECLWYPAFKKGYSGTAVFTKRSPDFTAKGIGIDIFDEEGRVLRADFGDTTLICAYFPSGSSGDIRQAVKMQFLDKINTYLEDLRKHRPKIIITGDFNIAHKPIDINFPKKHEKMSGFLPEEREWFDKFVALGWVDTFREFCNDGERYSWWSYRQRAKPKNLGWRIDYFMVTENMKPLLKGANILSEIDFSDHCPITLEVDL